MGKVTREDKQINTEIIGKIKAIRESKNLKQSDVAKKAKMNSNAYSKIERGESKPFGYTLVKIKRALGVRYTDILPD